MDYLPFTFKVCAFPNSKISFHLNKKINKIKSYKFVTIVKLIFVRFFLTFLIE